MKTKLCGECGVDKAFSEYTKHAGRKDGLRSKCKSCTSAYYKGYRKANKAILKVKNHTYYESNSHIFWESSYRIRASELGIIPVVERFTREQLVERHGEACVHCGGPFEHLDHYPVPVALGGTHSLENCVPSCVSCNTAQGPSVGRQRGAN